ncbi:hypothetical protein [Chitinophaga skermanii]
MLIGTKVYLLTRRNKLI